MGPRTTLAYETLTEIRISNVRATKNIIRHSAHRQLGWSLADVFEFNLQIARI